MIYPAVGMVIPCRHVSINRLIRFIVSELQMTQRKVYRGGERRETPPVFVARFVLAAVLDGVHTNFSCAILR
jgi:uncharacterized membrane protein YadS